METHDTAKPQFILYGTSACHLCEVAEAMIALQLPESDWSKVDISDSDTLFEKYGLLIPVLSRPDGRELNWPFSPQELARFVA